MLSPQSPRERHKTTRIFFPRPLGLRFILKPIIVAIIIATLFVSFPADRLISDSIIQSFLSALTSGPDAVVFNAGTPTQIRIGIVVGHWGNDSGAVCPDGTLEVDINLKVATLVQQRLQGLGFQADLLQEFDPRLQDYNAPVLLSIHSDSCEFVNAQATGFKVAATLGSRDLDRANRLAACLIDRYQGATRLPLHEGSITNDMTYYHAFDEIHKNTTAAIIEIGFMHLDKSLLTEQPALIAEGIVNGILCYVNHENFAPAP